MSDSGLGKVAIIRNNRPADKQAVLDLIARVWGLEVRDSYEFFWDWLHARDSICTNDKDIALVIENNGMVCGYSGRVPIRFKAGDSLLKGNYAYATSTDPSIRGEGYGARMMKKHIESDISIGSALSRATQLWKRIAGREIVIKPGIKMVKMLDPAPFLQARGVPSVLARVIATVWKLGTVLRMRVTAIGGKDKSNRRILESIQEYPEEINTLCQEFSRDFQYMVERDRDFLNWRFVLCPLGYENWLLRENGKVTGYIVYRFTMMNRRKILLLLEIMAIVEKKKNYRFMLDHLCKEGIRGRASDIQTLENGCPVLKGELKRQGFIQKKDVTPIIGTVNKEIAYVHDIWGSEKWFLGAGDAEFEFTFFKQGIKRREE